MVSTVMPRGMLDRVLYSGFRAEVWRRDDTLGWDDSAWRGHVALVLGAGNVTSIAAFDVLHQMFQEGRAVLLKLHPHFDSLEPIFNAALAPLVERDLLRIVTGDGAMGEALARHPFVAAVHITGSQRAHDALVWGPGPEGESRRKARNPRLQKPVTSELGCVTPIIVVPGKWSAREIAFQAENVASMVANNTSFNCNAARVLVTSKAWSQREEFLARLKAAFTAIPTRRAYYAGSAERWRALLSGRSGVSVLGEGGEGRQSWALVEGVAADAKDSLLADECWCPIVAEVPLDTSDPAAFLNEAVALTEKLPGSLSCGLIVDPRAQRKHRTAVEAAIAALHYGTVAVNAWPALGFGIGSTPWGAYPGNTLENVGSGIGFVHNPFGLHVEKSVVRAPFVVRPKPLWFATHRKALAAARALVDLEARPGLFKLLRVIRAAMHG